MALGPQVVFCRKWDPPYASESDRSGSWFGWEVVGQLRGITLLHWIHNRFGSEERVISRSDAVVEVFYDDERFEFTVRHVVGALMD